MIKLIANKGEIETHIHGTFLECGAEIAVLAEQIAKDHKELAEDMIFGISEILTREEIIECLDRKTKAKSAAKEIKNKLQKETPELAKLLKEILTNAQGEDDE